MPTWTEQAERLRPAKGLLHDAVDAVTHLVQEGQDALGDAVVAAASLHPSAAAPATQADADRRLVQHAVLGSVRAVNRGVERVTDAALDGVEALRNPVGAPPTEPAVPIREGDLLGPHGLLDQAVGALNGAVGDHLHASGNGLCMGLRLRTTRAWLGAPSATATGVVAVFVHGLSTTELSWAFGAQASLGSAHLGEDVEAALGATPLFARYNTGRSVHTNGAALAHALQRVLDDWPVPVEQLILIGHSMGGLVCRAATAAAHEADLAWLQPLTHVACLGTPHAGAPLARLGQAAAAGLPAVPHPVSRIAGRVLQHRSQGVQDLAHRQLPAAGPLLPGVRYLFVAGSVGQSPDDVLANTLGDMLVPVGSARGPHGALVTVRHCPGVPHHKLQASAAVQRVLLDWLAP